MLPSSVLNNRNSLQQRVDGKQGFHGTHAQANVSGVLRHSRDKIGDLRVFHILFLVHFFPGMEPATAQA
jgi:hypothetical protein